MQNRGSWQPTRILWDESRKTYVPNRAVIYGGSYHIADLQLQAYTPLIKAHISGDVLDCGCGDVPYLAMYEGQASSVTCVDWAGTHGANRFADHETDMNEGLPLADASCDSVLCTDVLAHIYKPHQLMKEMGRVLRPGGKLLLTTPFQYWISEPPHEYYRYTQYALERMAQEAGLELVKIEAYGGRLAVELDVINKRLDSPWGWRKFRLVRAWKQLWLRDTGAQRNPLGYCMVAQKPVNA